MKTGYNYLVQIAALVVVLALPASASLDIQGSYFEVEVSPGDRLTHEIYITLVDSNLPKNMSVDVLGYGQGLDGAVIGLEEQDDNSPYSVRSFVKASPERFELQPGVPQKVVLDINVPDDVGSGSRYALAFIHTDPEGDQIKIVTGVNVPVILNVKDNEKTIAGEVETLTVEEPVSAKMLNTSFIFENTGDTRYNILVEGLLEDEEGEVFAEASESTITPILPTYSRKVKLRFVPDQELEAGTYMIKVAVKHEDGTDIASKEIEFDV